MNRDFIVAPALMAVLAAVTQFAAPEAAAQVPKPGQGSTQPRPGAAAEDTLPVFEFHSGFWINLHHLLYREARLRQNLPLRRPEEEHVQPALAGLRAEEERAWQPALEYYGRELASRDLLFDGDMVNIKNRLAELAHEPDLQRSGLRAGLIAVLEPAAAAYRTGAWPEHDRANRRWVAEAAPLLERHGAALARELARVYQAPWPADRIRVDVVVHANWAGAYTTLNPLHVTLSSSDPRNQGPAALEILFHEASHGLAERVRDAIARECRARNKPIPRDLWHALLFYTTGEMVRRALGAPVQAAEASPDRGTPVEGYLPYAHRHGLYARGWQNYLRVIERHWRPHLDGQLEFDRAIARMAAAL